MDALAAGIFCDAGTWIIAMQVQISTVPQLVELLLCNSRPGLDLNLGCRPCGVCPTYAGISPGAPISSPTPKKGQLLG